MDKLNHSEIDTSLGYSEIDENLMRVDFPTAYEFGKVAKRLKKKSAISSVRC